MKSPQYYLLEVLFIYEVLTNDSIGYSKAKKILLWSLKLMITRKKM